jgi:hypothetical protein
MDLWESKADARPICAAALVAVLLVPVLSGGWIIVAGALGAVLIGAVLFRPVAGHGGADVSLQDEFIIALPVMGSASFLCRAGGFVAMRFVPGPRGWRPRFALCLSASRASSNRP